MTTLEVVDADRFAPYVAEAAQVYGDAMGRPPELVVQRGEIMAAHLHRRDFVAVLALGDDGSLVGFAYGYRGRAGEWWHDIVAEALGREQANRWMADAFELAELHVRPDHQGCGLGRQLLASIDDNATGTTIVLSTHDRESAARGLYLSAGFVDLLRAFIFPGSREVYAIMGKQR
jgi:ribosomal protein S18 acetylase RimI-like enzyme